MFRSSPELLSPTDEATIICRCEEVDARTIRHVVGLGCPGPNQLKAFCRAGMGPCQGRMCQSTIAEMMAKVCDISPGEIEALNIRPPVKPVTVAAMAALSPVSGDE